MTKKFMMWGDYCADVLEKRAPFRQAHLDRLKTLQESGQLLTIGPTQNLQKVFGIYIAEEEAIARQLIEADPYWINEIWTSYEILEWIQAL